MVPSYYNKVFLGYLVMNERTSYSPNISEITNSKDYIWCYWSRPSVCGTDINGAFCSRSVGWPRVQLQWNTTHKRLITVARMDTAQRLQRETIVLLFFCYILSANNSAKHTDSIHLWFHQFNEFISEWVPSEWESKQHNNPVQLATCEVKISMFVRNKSIIKTF